MVPWAPCGTSPGYLNKAKQRGTARRVLPVPVNGAVMSKLQAQRGCESKLGLLRFRAWKNDGILIRNCLEQPNPQNEKLNLVLGL